MNTQDRFIHKHGYALLFSNDIFVRELVHDFVNADLAERLDFSDFQAFTEKTFVTDDFREYADDLLTKVKIDGEEAYIYFLIEFQSSPDRFMALRVLNYLVLFYMELLKADKGLKSLPPVLPILLYNGSADWTSPENIKDLIRPFPFIEEFYPDFRYFKIIEKDFNKEDLAEIGNAVAAMFLVENTTKEQFESLTDELIRFISHESAQAIGLVALWMKQLYKNERIDKKSLDEVYLLKNEKEAKNMIQETVKQVKEEWLQQGIARGIEQGIEQGLEQGLEQGIEQGMHKKAFAAARALKRQGVDIKIISQATGLSEEEINSL